MKLKKIIQKTIICDSLYIFSHKLKPHSLSHCFTPPYIFPFILFLEHSHQVHTLGVREETKNSNSVLF